MTEVVVVSAVRTPFARFGGALKDFTLPDLGGLAVAEALRRAGVPAADVDEVVMGVNLPGSDRSIARQVLIKAGIPPEKVAYTVDRACCSSMTAITLASRSILVGESQVNVAGGTENMSKVPYFVHDMRWGKTLGDIVLKDQLVIACPMTGRPRAVQAGEEAVEYGVTRQQQDEWALRSHQNYFAAKAAGKFDQEIMPVAVPQGKGVPLMFAGDESPRQDTSLEKLGKLPLIYGSPTVTAGNAPGLCTGATALVLMDREEAQRRGIRPLATLSSWSMASGHPDRIASIPARAAKLALGKAGLTIDDIDLIEINEAFAAVPLVSTLILAGGDAEKAAAIRKKVNVNGGAVAIGHPTGATAARMVMTLIYELQRRGGGIGLATLCGGLGEAEAVIARVPKSDPK